MMRRFSSLIMVYTLVIFGSVGFAVSFVMAKDEDPKLADSKQDSRSDGKVDSSKPLQTEASGDPKSEAKGDAALTDKKGAVSTDHSKEVAGEKKSETRHEAQQFEKRVKPGACLTSEAAVEDIRHVQEDLEKKQKELRIREADLVTRENAISEELKKLEQARASILKIQQEQTKESEDKRAKLIEMFLAMSPKAAAKVLSTLDNSLAVSVMYQMDTPRLAKIMNLLEPKRSTELSELLVGLARAKDSATTVADKAMSRDIAEAKQDAKKGGEKQ